MKTRDFLWGLLACAAFSACSSDEVDSGTKEFKDKAYMRVQIAMAGNPSSRGTGGDYVYGDENEQKINNITFFFYDSSGNFVTEGEAVTNTAVTDNGTEKQYWEAETAPIISLKLQQGDPFPTQVVAYVNIGTSINFGNNRTISSDGQKVAESTTLVPSSFVMTSSTYVIGTSVVCSTLVSEKNFHETEAAAKADQDIVTIHVERLPAKVSVTQTDDINIEDVEDASGNKLKFTITGFALNGINTSSYLQKQVDASGWATSFSTWTDWTKQNEYRCFWAKDMNYEVTSKPTDLDFITYEEVGTPNTDAKYCYENTLELPLPTTGNTNLFENATHVLVFGNYKIKWENDEEYSTLAEPFYMYAGTAYLGSALKSLWAEAITDVYVSDGTSYSKADKENYELVSDGTTVDGVTLQLIAEKTYYKKTSETYTEYTDAERDTKNISLKNTYTATGYKNAVGYFPVLIEHFGIEGTDANVYDSTTELGVVRNHIYNIEIQSIRSLAEGIFNPEIEIIPDSSVKTYYLASKLRILSWKTVNQSVDL